MQSLSLPAMCNPKRAFGPLVGEGWNPRNESIRTPSGNNIEWLRLPKRASVGHLTDMRFHMGYALPFFSSSIPRRQPADGADHLPTERLP